MKKFILLIGCFVLFTACTQEIKVEYKKTAEVEIGNLKKDIANFKSTFVFLNLTEEDLVVRELKVNLKIDGKDIGTIYSRDAKAIRGHSEFSIPVKYEFEAAKIVENKEPETVYLIELDGKLRVRDKAGKEFDVPIKYKEGYTYKTKKEERLEKKEQKKIEKEKRKAEKKQLKYEA